MIYQLSYETITFSLNIEHLSLWYDSSSHNLAGFSFHHLISVFRLSSFVFRRYRMRSGELWRGDSLVSTLNSTRCWATTSKALSIIPLRYYHRNSTSISHVLMIIIITIIITDSITTLPYDKILPSHSRSHHQSYPTIPFASSSSSASASTSIDERSIGHYMTYLATSAPIQIQIRTGKAWHCHEK